MGFAELTNEGIEREAQLAVGISAALGSALDTLEPANVNEAAASISSNDRAVTSMLEPISELLAIVGL